jgi:hypothetical protein
MTNSLDKIKTPVTYARTLQAAEKGEAQIKVPVSAGMTGLLFRWRTMGSPGSSTGA